jgi:hypothetical protein
LDFKGEVLKWESVFDFDADDIEEKFVIAED